MGPAPAVAGSGGFSMTDTVGQWLSMWGAYEQQKLNNRLAETRLQTAQLEAVAKYSNPQAKTAGDTASGAPAGVGAWAKANPVMAGAVAIGLGLLAYLAIK